MIKSREIHLKTRPSGKITADNFELVTVDIPSPGENEVLIKNIWMSIDAAQRTLMDSGVKEVGKALPNRFGLGEVMDGQAIGQVIESRCQSLPVGTFVVHNSGWREYFTCKGELNSFTLRVIDPSVAPIQHYLHVISPYGAVAYYSLRDVARIKEGDTVWISTAAGTVGSIACQIAQMSGAKVVGTTGADEKVDWLLNNLGVDAAVNYKKADNLAEAMRTACPNGIDVYMDLVGGKHLEAAIDLMNPHGVIILLGQSQFYDGAEPSGPKNIFQAVLKRLRIQGFTVFDYLDQAHMSEYGKLINAWIAEGKITVHETIYEGIESAVQAQLDLLQGKNLGKMLVKLGEPESIG